ncbi:MAG TPA: thrombospondin type 3 repeat-containing protein, partial [Kofleriaceae bacterium]|nr:thrombospondin type 3 repeat-containing protein [Kofleriaceae bacterium]
MKRLSSALALLAAALPAAAAHALTIQVEHTPTKIGLDGTAGEEDGQTLSVVTIDLTSTDAFNNLTVDFSAWGIGEGIGVDLSNVELADVTFEQTGGLTLGRSLTGITVDNVNKRILLTIGGVPVSVAVDVRIIIRDIQNPPCPGTGSITVASTGLLGGAPGFDALTFTGGRIDADGDSMPDGFEIYYGAGMIRGDHDENPAYKNADLDPDLASDPGADFDEDGWSNFHEFLGCSNPADPASTPSDDDTDGDTIIDIDEQYPGEEVDTDDDGTPDFEDTDSDEDGVPDADEAGDNDPLTPPIDSDDDGIPDFQDPDSDNDGVDDGSDNCRFTPNSEQTDTDGDGDGDACDPDIDDDGVANDEDNCVYDQNPGQEDEDGDGIGDACEGDQDGDGVPDEDDNCASVPNPDQDDLDQDGIGDACDPDRDGDGIPDTMDNC